MKYIRSLQIFVLALTTCMLSQSCTNWLDVQRMDQILEDQAYENELRIKEGLNGIYLSMARNSAYGKNLTFYTTELMGQRYYAAAGIASSTIERGHIASMTYDAKEVRMQMDGIYLEIYTILLNINLYMEEVNKIDLKPSRKDILLGETYALRAFLHFDALRLFGPVPKAGEFDNLAIPYVTGPSSDWPARKTLTQVLENVLADIEKAEGLLVNDPILTKGVVVDGSSTSGDPEFFYTEFRNRRMNIYAVKMLKARVLAYKGDIVAAGNLAIELIDDPNFQTAFPWTTTQKFVDGDKIFSNEVIFGIHVADQYSNWNLWSSPAINSLHDALLMHKDNVCYIFNNLPTEAILTADWRINQFVKYKDPTYYLSNKLANLDGSSKLPEYYKYFQPLMRKSELYLLATEARLDVNYLDELRANRGLKPVDEELGVGTYRISEQIEKELMKETVCEGQIFYYYKRLNMQTIRSMDGKTRAPGSYVAPIPSAEANQ